MLKREATLAEIVEELDRRTNDTLKPLIPLYQALLRQEETVSALPLPLDDARAREAFARGTPLLHGAEGVVAQESMRPVWQEVCDLAAPHLAAQAERLLEAHRWPEADPQGWVKMMEQYFRSGQAQAEDAPTRNLHAFLLVHTWRPFLLPWARELAPLLAEKAWPQQRCPVCGGQPDFAILGEESGERSLVCARCDTAWRYKRMGCPFCGNENAASYGYYTDQAGVYRLYACKECNRYLKVLDLRQVKGEQRMLVVERIASIGMDLSAMEAGYQAA